MSTYRIDPYTWLGQEHCPNRIMRSPREGSGPCLGKSTREALYQDGEILTVCAECGYEWTLDLAQVLAKYGTPVDTDANKLARLRAVLAKNDLAWTAPQRRALEQALTEESTK